MHPKGRGYFFWDDLMQEMRVSDDHHEEVYVSPYNVGDVLVGEIVEDEPAALKKAIPS